MPRGVWARIYKKIKKGKGGVISKRSRKRCMGSFSICVACFFIGLMAANVCAVGFADTYMERSLTRPDQRRTHLLISYKWPLWVAEA